jgi:hypothetical protein
VIVLGDRYGVWGWGGGGGGGGGGVGGSRSRFTVVGSMKIMKIRTWFGVYLHLNSLVVEHLVWTRSSQVVPSVYLLIVRGCLDGFGGQVVSMLASGTRVRGFKPGRRKNPQHAFLRRGSERICPMSQLCCM